MLKSQPYLGIVNLSPFAFNPCLPAGFTSHFPFHTLFFRSTSGSWWSGSISIDWMAEVDGYINVHVPPRCQIFTGRCSTSDLPFTWVIFRSTGIANLSLFISVIRAPLASPFGYLTPCIAWSSFQVVKNHG